MKFLFNNSPATVYTSLGYALILATIAAVITLFMLRGRIIMDSPNTRSSHATPVPKSGGIAIVITFIIGMTLAFGASDELTPPIKELSVFFVSSLLVALISLYDDIKDTSFKVRLFVHILAAAILMSTGMAINTPSFPGIGYVALGLLSWPITLLWLVGLTNSYNFMDGIDGLAGGTAVLSGSFFAMISWNHGNTFTFIISLSVVAGVLGFLLFNWTPARIFMGDVGSGFLGFFFAAIALMAMHHDPHIPFLIMPLLLFHFIFDTALTFLRRLMGGEAVTQAHCSHLYQLFNQLGAGHNNVTLCLLGMNMLQGIGVLYMVTLKESSQLFVFLPFVALQSLYALIILNRAKKKGLI